MRAEGEKWKISTPLGTMATSLPAEILRELVSGVLGNRCQTDVLLAIDAVLQPTEQTIVERTMQVAESAGTT